LDPQIPSPQQFDHAINVVSVGGKEFWLDSTSGLEPFGYLLPQVRGKTALVVRYPGKSDLENAQPGAAAAGTYRFDLELTIAADGAQDAHLSLDVQGGDWEALLRMLLSRVSFAQYGHMFSDAWKQGLEGQNEVLSDFNNSDPYDTAHPLRLEARYHREPKPAAESQKPPARASQTPLVWPNWLVPLFPAPARPREDSKQPVVLNGPQEFFFHVKLTHPPSPAPAPVPSVHLTKDFAEYSFDATSDTTTITADAHLTLLVKELPAERSGEYEEFKKSAFTSLVPLSAAFRTAGSSPNAAELSASKSPSPAKPLLDAARSAAARREYATSAQLYEQAVAKDPEYTEAWNSLGWTYNTLRQYKKAEAALRKALALDAKARFVHNNLGRALAGQERYEEAISEYLKEIEINPNDHWAHANLGRIYVRMNQYEKAIPELETASDLTPNDPAVFFNLGSAYANTQQPDKAVKAFEHSVELEPVPARWNSVAYEMALEKLGLDEAQKFAESAISATEEQMRQVLLDSVSSEDISLPSLIAAYWDTLGWVRFQQGNLAEAEKYVRCAWQVWSLGEIGDHLGQIFEKQGRKSEAIQMYEFALVAAQPRPETKDRLLGLLGPGADIESVTRQAKQQLVEAQTVAIANTARADGIAEFWILLAPGPKVVGVKFISGDESLEQFTSQLAAATYPDSFPRAIAIQLLRRGRLSCSAASAQCRLLLRSADSVRSAN
jgi:tetratricopeptide (TPR) repeat protein